MDSAPDVGDPGNVNIREVTFNAENMPTTVKRDTGAVPQLLASYLYDGDGKRAKKSAGGKTTYYINEFCEVINGQLVKYVFAGNLRIARIQGGQVTYFHKDHLGSSTVMTDASGNVVESTAYLPYGGQRGAEAISGSGYTFTDQEWEDETGLFNYDARLYDPVVGLFLSADTIVPGAGFDPQMLNRFAYVRNNPFKYIDPSGHKLGGYNEPFLDEDEIGTTTNYDPNDYDDSKKGTKNWVGYDGRNIWIYDGLCAIGTPYDLLASLDFSGVFQVGPLALDAYMVGASVDIGIGTTGVFGGEIVINPGSAVIVEEGGVLIMKQKPTEIDFFTFGGSNRGVVTSGVTVYGGGIYNLPDNSAYEGDFRSYSVAASMGAVGFEGSFFGSPSSTNDFGIDTSGVHGFSLGINVSISSPSSPISVSNGNTVYYNW